jgi:hypothetical protein
MRLLCGLAMVNGSRNTQPELEAGKRRARADVQPTEPAASASRRDLLDKKCVCTDGEYKIVFYRRHIIDSIKIAELLEEELEAVKADRMQNWIMTPSMQFNLDCCDLAVKGRINRENASLSDDDKKALRLKRLTPIWDLTSEIFQFC